MKKPKSAIVVISPETFTEVNACMTVRDLRHGIQLFIPGIGYGSVDGRPVETNPGKISRYKYDYFGDKIPIPELSLAWNPDGFYFRPESGHHANLVVVTEHSVAHVRSYIDKEFLEPVL